MQILEGHFSADDSARLCRNYRYAAERMTRILAGWIALTPELSAKLLLGRHVWDNAQHADAWGKRLPELRALAQQSEPPTCRILSRCIEDERRHIGAGETIIRHLAASAEVQGRVDAWQARLALMLEAAGGVTGQGSPPVMSAAGDAAVPISDDAREFIRLERAGEKWAVPEDLETAVRAFGNALVTGDGIGLGGFLEAAPDAALMQALKDVGIARHQVAAFAKLGRHRIIKYRLSGPGGAVTLNARWEQGESGWRVGAVDLVKIEQSQPA